MRKIHAAALHKRSHPPVLRGELKGFCRLGGKDTDGLGIGEAGRLGLSGPTQSVFHSEQLQL